MEKKRFYDDFDFSLFFNTHVCMKRSRYFEELAREHTAGFGMLVV